VVQEEKFLVFKTFFTKLFMLNRRLLRIKVMQFIYAYKQAQHSDYQLSLDLIQNTFSPDLNSMQAPDHKRLEGNKQMASLLFEENAHTHKAVNDDEATTEVNKAATDAINFYFTQLTKDRAYLGKQMVADVEGIFDRYLWLLLLIVELADYAQREEEERMQRILKPLPAASRELKFFRNQAVDLLRLSTELEKEAVRRGISWKSEADREFVRKIYREVIKADATYQAYQQLSSTEFEEDRKIVQHIVKSILFKHDLASSFFGEIDINWSENADILKGMVTRTVKSLEEGNPQSVQLLELSPNWEDDKEFMKDLFKHTLDNDDQYEQLISGKAKNWDIERLAMLDRIILKMAIAEMLHFPSIPVKVTINEYIELSKEYSTPKSKQFVNGILDATVAELTANNLLKKSGRGLIDNK
jgi:N utilization substance protein B